jgi:hypothetical protein
MKVPSFMVRRSEKGIPPDVRSSDLPPAMREDPTGGSGTDLPKTAVTMPSRGVFYAGKDQLMLSPLTVGQVKNIFSANRIKSEYDQARSMASVVQQSVHNFDVSQLTTDDYRFVMYWLKLNSYPAVPFTVRWSYFDGAREKDVQTAVTMSNWEIVSCDTTRAPHRDMDYPRLRDQIELLKIEDPAERYIAEFAQALRGDTLAAKVARLLAEPASLMHDVKHHLLDFEHGVSEHVNVSDPEGKEPEKTYQVGVTLSLSDFFP